MEKIELISFAMILVLIVLCSMILHKINNEPYKGPGAVKLRGVNNCGSCNAAFVCGESGYADPKFMEAAAMLNAYNFNDESSNAMADYSIDNSADDVLNLLKSNPNPLIFEYNNKSYTVSKGCGVNSFYACSNYLVKYPKGTAPICPF